ncbi:MAG TPA: FAD-dependent oxidoreductase [Gaiellaceae bacterium]|nr:FAD-dependent oxidoreductase [Gaiellaceae bacterium]
MAAPIAVVGAGVVGLACARELRRAGADVVVVDSGRVGAAASSGNAGWVCPSLSSPLASPGAVEEGLRQMLHRERAFAFRPRFEPVFWRWLWRFLRSSTSRRFEAGTAALLELNRLTMQMFDEYRSDGVPFEMRETGIVFAALSEDGLAPYLRLARLLQRLGYPGRFDRLEDPLAGFEPALNGTRVRHAMYASADRIVHPGSLTSGLADVLRRAGVVIHEEFPVRRVQRRRGRWVVEGARGGIECEKVVVAAGLGTRGLLREHGVKVPMVGAGGYSVMVADAGDPPRHALYLAEAKLAVSPFRDGVRIAGVFELGGRAVTAARADGLELARSAAPYVTGWQPTAGVLSEYWAGLRPTTPNGLPVIGGVPGAEDLFVAAGHTMLGVTLAPATARVLAPLVLRGERRPELLPFELTRTGHQGGL